MDLAWSESDLRAKKMNTGTFISSNSSEFWMSKRMRREEETEYEDGGP